jgi:hypothetical protein
LRVLGAAAFVAKGLQEIFNEVFDEIRVAAASRRVHVLVTVAAPERNKPQAFSRRAKFY